MNTLPKGTAVHFDDRHLHVELEDGRIILTPMTWYEELQQATHQQLCKHQFICQNTGIEWPELDYQLSIESMLAAQSREQAA